MSFTLKDIKGAVVDKIEGNCTAGHEFLLPLTCHECAYIFGYTQALEAQSSIRLRFNRENLALIIEKWLHPRNKDCKVYGFQALELADSIISADKDIIEVQP